LGSGTHLLRAGSSGYAKAWVEAAGRLVKIARSVRICPLVPILSGSNPGTLFRSLVEVHCWFSVLFGSDARGLGEVWSLLIQIMQQLTPPCTPLPSTQMYTLPYPGDLGGNTTRNLSFSYTSSCPDSVYGPDCKAIEELLLCLSSALNRDFHTSLGPELNLPRDRKTEPAPKETHFTLIGGSNTGPLKHHLEELGAKVTDLSKSGWICNTANSQLLMMGMGGEALPENTVFVLDLLGNSSVRFRQSDDGDSLPVKLGGSWHLLGEVRVMNQDQVEKTLSNMEHFYKHDHSAARKIFCPPLPRYVFGGCCGDLGHGQNIRSQGHAEKMVTEFVRVRQNIKSVLVRSQVQNMRVLDSLGALTGKNTVAEQVTELRKVTARDNVHLTADGYKSLALGVFKEAAMFSAPKVKTSKHDAVGAPQDWHGFLSHVGIGKAATRKARSASHATPRAHPYRGRGGGRGRGKR